MGSEAAVMMGGFLSIDLYPCRKAYNNSSITLTASRHIVSRDFLKDMIILRCLLLVIGQRYSELLLIALLWRVI